MDRSLCRLRKHTSRRIYRRNSPCPILISKFCSQRRAPNCTRWTQSPSSGARTKQRSTRSPRVRTFSCSTITGSESTRRESLGLEPHAASGSHLSYGTVARRSPRRLAHPQWKGSRRLTLRYALSALLHNPCFVYLLWEIEISLPLADIGHNHSVTILLYQYAGMQMSI